MHPVRLAVADPDARRLDCRRVRACLDVAIVHEWDGFACDGCSSYAAPNAEELRADVLGCAELWNASHRAMRTTAAQGSEGRESELLLDDEPHPRGER